MAIEKLSNQAQEVSAQPQSSYSQFEKSFAMANKVAKIRIMIASGAIAVVAVVVLLGVIVSLGEMNGNVRKVFIEGSSSTDVPEIKR